MCSSVALRSKITHPTSRSRASVLQVIRRCLFWMSYRAVGETPVSRFALAFDTEASPCCSQHDEAVVLKLFETLGNLLRTRS